MTEFDSFKQRTYFLLIIIFSVNTQIDILNFISIPTIAHFSQRKVIINNKYVNTKKSEYNEKREYIYDLY
jgi:hypothetical protein